MAWWEVRAISKGSARFLGRRAIVTGGGSGIGLATGVALAREGARVVLGDRSLDRANQIADEIGRDVTPLSLDVLSEDSCRVFISSAVRELGGLDILINCAGVGGVGPPRALGDLPSDAWRHTIDTNLTGTYLVTHFALPHMSRGGAIVNLASTYAIVAGPKLSAYSASKGGIVQLTRAVAVDYAHAGIRANAIAPGFVDTPMLRGDIAKSEDPLAAMADILERIPLGRLMEAEEVAKSILFLASDDAAIITGSLLCADGGYTAI